MELKPTEEQLDILKTFKQVNTLKIQAVAGAGKTSVLRMLAEDNKEPSLYVCYNRVIAEEARTKFPSHVECRTTHSLAYAEFGKYLEHKLRFVKGRFLVSTNTQLVNYFNIKDIGSGKETIPARSIASLANKTVNRFQNSAEDKITFEHIPYHDVKELTSHHPNLDTQAFCKQLTSLATQMWNARINPRTDVKANDDTYLKMWQLSKPKLKYGIIYFDEAQDSNPAVLDVVKQQKAKMVFVGDTYQSIYQFRNAVNAMETIDAPVKYLSKSFRYGKAVADIASMIISDEIKVEGMESIKSSIGQFGSEPYTQIFRTNGKLLEAAVELIEKKANVFIEVDTKDFCKQLASAEALMRCQEKYITHAGIACYPTWEDLKEAAKEDAELNRIVAIVSKKNTRQFINALEKLSTPKKADIILTTAHKSKGKEWSNVVIADDFPFKDKESLVNMPQAEINLLYVACTRAINKLDVPCSLEEAYLEYTKEKE